VIAVGEFGTILKGNHFTDTWNSVTAPVQFDLLSVHCLNDTKAWAAGRYGTILTTSDSGTTWIKQASTVINDLATIFFCDSLCGFAAGASGTLLRTQNSGLTWEKVTSYTNGYPINEIFFFKPNLGWLVTNSGLLFRTTDSGTTWTQITAPTYKNLLSIRFVTADTGWMLGDADALWKSCDSGKTWEMTMAMWNSSFKKVRFNNNNHNGCVVGDKGYIAYKCDEPPIFTTPVRMSQTNNSTTAVNSHRSIFIITADGFTNFWGKTNSASSGAYTLYSPDGKKVFSGGGNADGVSRTPKLRKGIYLLQFSKDRP
jgi:photosystem II stability/assembly factor-like uncharacterized protein